MMISVVKTMGLIIIGSMLVYSFSCAIWYASGGGDIIKW